MKLLQSALIVLSLLFSDKVGAHGDHHDNENHDNDQRFLEGGRNCGTKDLTPEESRMAQKKMSLFPAKYGKCDSKSCAFHDNMRSDIVVPTVFHNVRNNDGSGGASPQMIQDAIDIMNDAFAGTGFLYELVGIREWDNSDWAGHNYGTATEFDMKSNTREGGPETLNIWSCANLAGGLLGYATFPSWYEDDPLQDGVVILSGTNPGGNASPYDEGDTLVHEVGHWLFLYHVFQGGCSDGDEVDDTPASQTNFGCPSPGHDSCPGQPGTDKYFNYMDYVDDDCMDSFTPGQIARMLTAWVTYRDNDTPLPPTVAPVPTPAPTPEPTLPPLECSDDEALFHLNLLTDLFGEETTWELVNECTNEVVAGGGPFGPNGEMVRHVEEACVPKNQQYSFYIYDSYGDGICCGQYGDGEYTIYLDGEPIESGSEFEASMMHTFGECDDDNGVEEECATCNVFPYNVNGCRWNGDGWTCVELRQTADDTCEYQTGQWDCTSECNRKEDGSRCCASCEYSAGCERCGAENGICNGVNRCLYKDCIRVIEEGGERYFSCPESYRGDIDGQCGMEMGQWRCDACNGNNKPEGYACCLGCTREF